MNRDQFIAHLEAGKPATLAVKEITGYEPVVVTIDEHLKDNYYQRYGIMMAGPLMVALVILILNTNFVQRHEVDRIRNGEPCGSVLKGMHRTGFVQACDGAVKAGARLSWDNIIVGEASEIFTESLFK